MSYQYPEDLGECLYNLWKAQHELYDWHLIWSQLPVWGVPESFGEVASRFNQMRFILDYLFYHTAMFATNVYYLSQELPLSPEEMPPEEFWRKMMEAYALNLPPE